MRLWHGDSAKLAIYQLSMVYGDCVDPSQKERPRVTRMSLSHNSSQLCLESANWTGNLEHKPQPTNPIDNSVSPKRAIRNHTRCQNLPLTGNLQTILVQHRRLFAKNALGQVITTICHGHYGAVSKASIAGHYTYQCNKQRPYISRPSRTQQLENPRVLAKLKTEGKPSVEVPEEFRKKWVTCRLIFILLRSS